MKRLQDYLSRLVARWVEPAAQEPELARRQRFLNLILLCIIIPTFIFGATALILFALGQGPGLPAISSLGIVLVNLSAYLAGRRGRLRIAHFLLLGSLLAGLYISMSSARFYVLSISSMAVIITIAALLLGARGTISIILLSLAIYIFAPGWGPLASPDQAFAPEAGGIYNLLGLSFTLLAVLGLNWLAIQQAQQSADLEERTERIEQERDFAESLITTAHAFIVVLDLEGRVLRVNPYTEKTTGYSSKEIAGLDWFETFLPQRERRKLRQVFGRILETEGVHRELNLIQAKDGRELMVEWHSSTLIDKHGKSGAVLAIGIDLTDQLQAREAASAREAQMASLFRVAPMGIGLLKDRVFLLVNDRFADMLGYIPEELNGQSTRMIYPDEHEHGKAGIELYGAVREKGIGIAETRMLRKDGVIIDVLESVAPVDPNEPDGEMTFTTQDITTIKQAEETLRLSEYSIDQAGEAILWIGPEGKVLRGNPTACRLLSIREDALVGMPHYDIREDLSASDWKTHWSRVLSQGTIVERTHWKPKDGDSIPVEVSSCFMTFEGKEFILAFARDMTEMIETQMRAQAQDRLAAIGQLAAGIAHDFNNIMAGIILYAQMLHREEGLSDAGRGRLERIQAQAHRGSDLISQILDFSRQSLIELEPTDFAAFLGDLMDLLRRTLPETIDISIEAGEAPMVVMADPGRLQQIVMNLAINARDAMPDGGRLSITLDGFEVHSGQPAFRDMPPGDWVRLKVRDTGTGIAREHLSRLFEPFFTTKEAGKGTGLGLAQVYGIVKQHQGYIDVETELGQGTTFIVYLPRGKVQDLETQGRESATLLNADLRVLLVEDDDSVRAAISDMLEMFGCTVTEAKTGQEALNVLASQREGIDLVLSDMVMPTMGGRQLFEAVRTGYPDVNFILMTGYPLGHDTGELIDKRYAVLLRKPFTVEELSEAIRTARQRAMGH